MSGQLLYMQRNPSSIHLKKIIALIKIIRKQEKDILIKQNYYDDIILKQKES